MSLEHKDMELLKKVLGKCREIDIEEIRAILYSDYPVVFLEAFIDGLDEEIKKRSA